MKIAPIARIILALWSLSACASAPPLHGSVYEPPSPAPPLDLMTTDGIPFDLSDLQGQVVLVFFGYTSCPDVCPATLAEVSWIFDQLGSRATQVEFIFVTVDPQRDSPAVVQDHLSRFNPHFLGLGGTEAALARARAEYGVYAERDPGGDAFYTLTHTSRVFLVDNRGRLRTSYTFDEAPDTILADILTLLDG